MSNVTVDLKWEMGKITSIETRSEKGLVRMAYDIASQARANAPYKTGALSNSIRVEDNGGEVLVIAGGKVSNKDIRYAAIQEWGGLTGRNHSTRIEGKHYMERAKDHIMTGNYLQKYLGDVT
jgi:phage gpG-like protein